MKTSTLTRRLLVSRQDPRSRAFEPVGTLTFDGGEYVFEYVSATARPLPGLRLGVEHRDSELFPVFAERVLDPHRPEQIEILDQLGLPHTAGPFEVLAVSGGGRTGDTFELTPLPERGPVDLPFLVHGVRHRTAAERDEIDQLTPGEPLTLRPERDNPVNPRALLVTRAGFRLGYVPDPLLEYVYSIARGPHQLRVERVNPRDAGMHMRLLVSLRGEYTGDDPGSGTDPTVA